VTTTVFVFCADPNSLSVFLLGCCAGVLEVHVTAHIPSIAVILIMALAGCPDYFLHHPNYQVYSSVVVVLWSLQSFKVQQGTMSVFLDCPVISQAEYACKT